MSQVRDALRIVGIGLQAYHMKTPFLLGNNAYIAVGEVQDLANAFVCLELNEEDVPRGLVLVTFFPDEDRFEVRPIERTDSMAVADNQRIDCTMLSALVAGRFDEVLGQVPPTQEARVQGIQAFAIITLDIAIAAGVFGGQFSHEDVMEYGKNSIPPPGPARKTPQARFLAEKRRLCRPGDLQSIRDYAEYLITVKAYEILFADDGEEV